MRLDLKLLLGSPKIVTTHATHGDGARDRVSWLQAPFSWFRFMARFAVTTANFSAPRKSQPTDGK
jgi:hypothetical protein